MKKHHGQIKIQYNEKEDSFELLSRVGNEGWGLVMSCKCFPIAQNPSPEYIHFTILNEINRAIQLGYELV